MGDTSKIGAGKPNISGAIYRAAVGATLPTDATTTLDTTVFTELGYASEDGITNSESTETSETKAWGGDTVNSSQTAFTDKFKVKFLEALNADVLSTVHGSDNVTGTLATGITVAVNSSDKTPYSWVVDMIINGANKRVVVPSAKVTEMSDVVYKSTEVVGYEVTLTATPDSAGNTHYEYIYKA